MNDEKFEVFKSQDLEKGYFDVIFEVEEKHIYAHKFMLAPISTTFKSIFSTNWNKEETIKIKTNSYNEFYEFLTFIYSGNCNFNDENIFGMVDIAEAYQVETLLQKCDQYLSEKEYTSGNVLEFFNNLFKYFNSLPMFEKKILTEVKKHFPEILESEHFITLPKEIVEKIVSFKDRFASEELLFQKVYEWTENQVNIRKQREKNNEKTFNQNDAIKAEIAPFLPYIKFNKMDLKFLHRYVVKRGFLFSYNELSDILESTYSDVKVKITDSSGSSIYGFLPLNSKAVEIIKSLKNCLCFFPGSARVYWNIKSEIPSTPSLIKKKDGVEWYLIYFDDGRIGVSHHSFINDKHYLLAEMKSAISGFTAGLNCKIEIE